MSDKNRFQQFYNLTFRRKISDDEAQELRRYIKEKCHDCTQNQVIEALENLSKTGEYADKQLPSTAIVLEIQRVMATEELDSLPDGCTVCDFKGLMTIDTDVNSFTLPCSCVKGTYMREHCKPWCDFYGAWEQKLTENINYWHKQKKEGRIDMTLLWETWGKRADDYWKSIGKKPDQYVDKSTIVIPPSGPVKMGSEDECDF